MITYNVEQQSNAWFDLRCGKITGTRFASLMMGESTKGYKDLISDIVGEIITETKEETYTNEIMQRGIDLEPEARKAYESIYNIEVDQIGFITPHFRFEDWIGISPDGIMFNGLLEIKCPLRKTHLSYIKANKLPNEYKWQVQGQLFVTSLKWCDFMSYYPDMKPFIIRVLPDKEMHEQIKERLESTIELIKKELEFYNNYEIN